MNVLRPLLWRARSLAMIGHGTPHSRIIRSNARERLTTEDRTLGKCFERGLLRVLEPFIQVLAVAVIAGTSFISSVSALAQNPDFPRDWSECDCHFSSSRGMLGCVNVADNYPRGLWLVSGDWRVVVADKWTVYGSTIIPMAYRIGAGEVETSTMLWNADSHSAYSPDSKLHDRLLLAIFDGRRIAIKLAHGPVHIIQGCHDGRDEAKKYIDALDRSEQ